MQLRRPLLLGTVVLLLAGCDAAEGVPIEELPSLQRSSPEARAGLPEVAGEWRLAGVEVAAVDTAAARMAAQGRAALRIETQRLDSLAGVFVAPGVRLPLVGEVRRDGTVALAGRGPAGESLIVAGRLRGDTLWVEIVEPAAAAPWPAGARGALIRGAPGPRFARSRSGALLYLQRPPPPPGSAAPGLARADSLADSSTVSRGEPPIPTAPSAPQTPVRPSPPVRSVAPEPRTPPRPPPPELPEPDSLLPALRDSVIDLDTLEPKPDSGSGFRRR